MKPHAILMIVSLTACSSPPPYESVTINLSGGISCTERIILDNRDSSGVEFTKVGENTRTDFDIDLGALAIPFKNNEKGDLRQRCEDLINIAEEHAAERVRHLRLQSERIESELETYKLRDELDRKHIADSMKDFGDGF